ncbi:MAG: cation diffusion facilitator family transporter [Planctomycetes bacterium]|nr:cation diffusion facilitator family transporter [Planctomycetota bacterium]MCH9726529.1 cation diffusion facilitator family transporter [Planctomycetota bacterium]MCH9779198.1 cation diffusion facilitator family transporter [Planctomycetota bacterium]MCH9790564.1 cation diffusion facilitator family transporter [Planctomycetota bacterium]
MAASESTDHSNLPPEVPLPEVPLPEVPLLDMFPKPLALSDDVSRIRHRRTSRLIKVSWLGISVRCFVIVIELIGLWYLGHSVLLVDALASSADVLTSLAILFAIRLAEQPPDEDHPFGHGRYEPLAGFQLGLLILVVGTGTFAYQLFAAISHPQSEVIGWVSWTIPLTAAILLELTCRIVLKMARQENSSAMIAEAYHYRVDAITSFVAAFGLIIASQIPGYGHLIDHITAMILAVIMIYLGWVAARENLNELTDKIPNQNYFDQVKSSALKVEGVLDVEKVRIQTAGPDAHVNIDIEVNPEETVDHAHVIAQQVRQRIQLDWPTVREVVVHVEPYYEADH